MAGTTSSKILEQNRAAGKVRANPEAPGETSLARHCDNLFGPISLQEDFIFNLPRAPGTRRSLPASGDAELGKEILEISLVECSQEGSFPPSFWATVRQFSLVFKTKTNRI